MTTTFAATEQNRFNRHSERGRYDKDEIYPIIDEALICHVGIVEHECLHVLVEEDGLAVKDGGIVGDAVGLDKTEGASAAAPAWRRGIDVIAGRAWDVVGDRHV